LALQNYNFVEKQKIYVTIKASCVQEFLPLLSPLIILVPVLLLNVLGFSDLTSVLAVTIIVCAVAAIFAVAGLAT